MTLINAKQGKVYKIKQVGGDWIINRRLLDLGLTMDTKIYLAMLSPLGDSYLIGIRDVFIAIRDDIADLIEIE